MKQVKELEDYPLFYEELARRRQPAKKPMPKTRPNSSKGLSETEVAKLGDDLRKPMRGSVSETNPMQ